MSAWAWAAVATAIYGAMLLVVLALCKAGKDDDG